MDLSQLLRALGLQQAYQSYQENIGQPFANVAGPFGRGLLGLEKPEYGEEQAYRTGQAVGNMPAVSAPVGAFKAAAQVPGLLADATQAMKGLDLAGLLGLTAYQGSPYRFSKFDPTKIGSGEGAQAYGYGHYFAESPDVAKGYRERLSGSMITFQKQPETDAEKWVRDTILGKASAMQEGNKQLEANAVWNRIANPSIDFIKGNKYMGIPAMNAEGIARMEAAKNLGKPTIAPTGSLYTVDIPDEMIGRMLDWDKPLGKQPQLKAVLDKIGKEIALPKMQDAEGAGFAYGMLANAVGGPKNASAMLREYGIPGVAYLDQGSRGAGQGTRNFVVFPGEEEAIKMLNVE